MAKQRDEQNEVIKKRIAKALNEALKARKLTKPKAALLLQVELATLYKYLDGDMIPGGQVLWRACDYFGMVLDRNGFRVVEERRTRTPGPSESVQYGFPFINEQLEGDSVSVDVKKKGSEYVQVNLRIKVAS